MKSNNNFPRKEYENQLTKMSSATDTAMSTSIGKSTSATTTTSTGNSFGLLDTHQQPLNSTILTHVQNSLPLSLHSFVKTTTGGAVVGRNSTIPSTTNGGSQIFMPSISSSNSLLLPITSSSFDNNQNPHSHHHFITVAGGGGGGHEQHHHVNQEGNMKSIGKTILPNNLVNISPTTSLIQLPSGQIFTTNPSSSSMQITGGCQQLSSTRTATYIPQDNNNTFLIPIASVASTSNPSIQNQNIILSDNNISLFQNPTNHQSLSSSSSSSIANNNTHFISSDIFDANQLSLAMTRSSCPTSQQPIYLLQSISSHSQPQQFTTTTTTGITTMSPDKKSPVDNSHVNNHHHQQQHLHHLDTKIAKTNIRIAASSGNSSSSSETKQPIMEVGMKREMRLSKNRMAARECRRKKKEYLRCLESRVQTLEQQNQLLIEELSKYKTSNQILMDELTRMKSIDCPPMSPNNQLIHTTTTTSASSSTSAINVSQFNLHPLVVCPAASLKLSDSPVLLPPQRPSSTE